MMLRVPRVPGGAPVRIHTQPAKGKFNAMGFSRDHGLLAAQLVYHGTLGAPLDRQRFPGSGIGRVVRNSKQVLYGNR
jgi:hypothetical protein